jgi:FkbM family methyltransferase
MLRLEYSTTRLKHRLKKIAARLPARWQQELKRWYFRREIRSGLFHTTEAEYGHLADFISLGDWVLDVGANVGHYTMRLSELVGKSGRVFAFEPVPETFELLAANMAFLQERNVTLLNVAVSDSVRVLGMKIPRFDSGLTNYYMAQLSTGGAELEVLCVAIDLLAIPKPISFAKIDAEGHELSVLKGMVGLLRRDHPVLVVEDNSRDVSTFLRNFGYQSKKLKGSSNRIFTPALGQQHQPRLANREYGWGIN